MLWFERRVVSTLTAGMEEPLRSRVTEYVDETLGVMPPHLRAGMVAESLALGAWARVRARGDARLESLDASPIDPVRQYVRLFRSLVLFAEHEL
jgi:hypothetical protein